MDAMLSIWSESDIIVIATPVYVDGMSGPMKTLLDRTIPLINGSVELRENHMRHVPRNKVKNGKIALVSTSGFSELDNFDALVTHIKAVAKNLNREYSGELLIPGGWYLLNDKQVCENALQLITSAGEALAIYGQIPSVISDMIASLVNRSKVMEALNWFFKKFEQV